MSNYNPDWVNHIDWSKNASYKDLAVLFRAIGEAFNSADVTSGTNGLVDGYVKRGILERLSEFATVFDNPEHWLIVREPRNYTHHEGHKK